MNDIEVEKEIQDKELNFPRTTPDTIAATVIAEAYHTFPGTQLTVCCLTLTNGFTVTGESACVSPENFDMELVQKLARSNAVDKIWLLEGYLLKQKLFNAINS